MSSPLRRTHPRLVARVAAPVLAVILSASLAGPVGASGASSKSVALAIADYALGTATHERPAQVVNAADVTNAASISSINTKNLYVLINVGDVFSYPRLVLFFNEKPFTDTCVNFPDTVGGTPTVVACPKKAQGLWNSHAAALSAADYAIATAAARGQAVSGADIVAAARRYSITLVSTPTFAAGKGGVVKFATVVEMPPRVKFTVDNCVRLPTTEFGVPVEVAC